MARFTLAGIANIVEVGRTAGYAPGPATIIFQPCDMIEGWRLAVPAWRYRCWLFRVTITTGFLEIAAPGNFGGHIKKTHLPTNLVRLLPQIDQPETVPRNC